jgi:hypothetical protein
MGDGLWMMLVNLALEEALHFLSSQSSLLPLLLQ